MFVSSADPFELQNRFDQLKPEERSYLHDQLKHLIACKGRSCTINHHNHHYLPIKPKVNSLPLHGAQQQKYKKRKFADDFGNG